LSSVCWPEDADRLSVLTTKRAARSVEEELPQGEVNIGRNSRRLPRGRLSDCVVCLPEKF
jgi:hypothetical protein